MSPPDNKDQPEAVRSPRIIVASQHYASTAERAFQAWTDPLLLTQWFGPPGYEAEVLLHELKVNGCWKISMNDGEGNQYHHFGTFLEISEPSRLIFTWASEEQIAGWRDVDGNPTIVTVDFLASSEGVEVKITHENLITDLAFDALSYGWNGSLQRLQLHLPIEKHA